MQDVICCRCYETTQAAVSCAHCGEDPILVDSWHLVEMLGHGASGYTWKATEGPRGRQVAIKELSFRKLTDLKQLELFQREARALSSIEHPGIPHYEDDFVVEERRHVGCYLVQEFIDGQVLDHKAPWNEAQVIELLAQVAEILAYLHTRHPPVVHRDIKPANIMRRLRDDDGGRYVLIDFGSTRAALDSANQSTIAGTLGYMAPEQLMGRADGRSDIYGLGATAVALLSGQHAHLVLDALKPESWWDAVRISKPLRRLISDMLQPEREKRVSSARELIERLQSLKSSSSSEALSHRGALTPNGVFTPMPAPAKRRRGLRLYVARQATRLVLFSTPMLLGIGCGHVFFNDHLWFVYAFALVALVFMVSSHFIYLGLGSVDRFLGRYFRFLDPDGKHRKLEHHADDEF